MATAPDNEKRLRDAGVILGTAPKKLEEPFQAVVDGMTPYEVDVLIALKRRLDEADRVVGWDPRKGEGPPSSTRMPP
jgi:hypothetical protein